MLSMNDPEWSKDIKGYLGLVLSKVHFVLDKAAQAAAKFCRRLEAAGEKVWPFRSGDDLRERCGTLRNVWPVLNIKVVDFVIYSGD